MARASYLNICDSETYSQACTFVLVKREEAKIIAWENLQKAKTEAAIRKLEIKLKKKSSSSMDRIMKKLRLAKRKAQEMRTSILDNKSQQIV
ncbi:hypothetical protein Syun_009467 [Stephania yunnanensis]|uniref:Remorin C-terminal domain-containing protein n=1 Tax=Stephania yunnanensis TaxID=152371 RepID=A0AAP0KG72_9MAGN